MDDEFVSMSDRLLFESIQESGFMPISPANFGEEITTFEQRTEFLQVPDLNDSDKPIQLSNRTSLIQEFYCNAVDNQRQRDYTRFDSLEAYKGAPKAAAAPEA